MKYIKIKPGNSILQAAGQFHAFVLIFLQNAGLLFHKTRKFNFTNADFQFYFLRTSDFTKCGSVIGENDFKHIKWFREHLAKDREFMGIVLYSGEDTLPFGENMFAVPTASLWE